MLSDVVGNSRDDLYSAAAFILCGTSIDIYSTEIDMERFGLLAEYSWQQNTIQFSI